ncbi:bifunctional aminoglycoside phosphotransferase/ATP-binding protein [Thiolapillus brandeum]|nr:bifunctional aminoglycoside phosphotransferase/ATP-binding protein [Thiolapillus brandeum]
MPSAEQTSMISSLMESSSLDGKPSERLLVETHISWVILAGDFAYKIKKPVDLGFLDFSTLENRHRCCEEELRLNLRLAPEYYLEVVPITRTKTEWQLQGSGRVVEYAVKMKRFDTRQQLDVLASRGELSAVQIDAVASLLAEFHRSRAEVSRTRGTAAQVCGPARDNFSHIARLRGDTLPSAFRQLQAWNEQACKNHSSFMELRREQGWIRECHGDLHLGNMAWVDDKPLIFDAIEFNPDLRWIDTLSETAFLVMDLCARGEAPLAWRFLNHYLEYTGDYQGLRLLPFYLVYRAMVRAKIAAIRCSQLQAGEEKDAADQEFSRYLALALDFSRSVLPQLVITHGLSGSGKSTFSAGLVEKAGFIRIRSDVERKRLFDLEAQTPTRAAPLSGIYTPGASEKVYEKLLDLAAAVLDAGFNVVVDAAFLQEHQRTPFRALARDRRLRFSPVILRASPEELRERVARRKNDVSDADLAVLEHQLAGYVELSPGEQEYALVVDTGLSWDWDGILSDLGLR